MVVGSNILRRVPWSVAALVTPTVLLVTGVAFFGLIVFEDRLGFIAEFLGVGPLVLAVYTGLIQNVMSKSIKYSLFDPTKEMSYIPLDDEMKSKGKAAVDVVGGRFGKAGGGVIQSTVFLLFPSYTFNEATPFFGFVFILVMVAWVSAVGVFDGL